MNYLVNGWLVQPEFNRIVTESRQIQLEPRNMRLLVYLIEHKGEVISREILSSEVWQCVIVNDESLTRSIADLRKVFSHNPQSTKVIETIRKVGYRFIAELTPAPARKIVLIRKCLLTVMAIVLLTTISYSVLKPNVSFPKLQSVFPQTSKNGLELSASFSHQGDRIVYYYLDLDNPKKSGLEILSTDDGQTIRLNTVVNEFSPVWSWDDRKIAYRAINNKKCSLYYYDLHLQKNFEIGKCPGLRHWKLLWIPGDEKLLVSASTTAESPIQLWEVDIETGLYNLSPGLPDSIVGLIYPTFSKDGRYLGFVNTRTTGILIRELSPVVGTITKFDWINKSVVAELKLDEEITGFDFDVDDQYIVYSSAEESLRFKLWYGDFEGNRQALYPDNAKIADPKISSNRNIIYEQRNMNKDIVKINIKQGNSETVANSTRWDMQPAYDSKNDRFAFMSTRSGKVEIWIQDQLNDQLNDQLKKLDLREGANTHPQFSPTQNQLVFISTSSGNSDLFLVDLERNDLHQLTHGNSQEKFPTWSMDGNWIYFSKYVDKTPQIWKIKIDGSQTVQITKQGGLRGQEIVFKGEKSLLYSKYNSNSLWLKSLPNGEERKFSTIKITNQTGWYYINQDLFYLTSLSGNSMLYKYNIETEESLQIASLKNDIYQSILELAISSNGEFALVTVGSDMKIDLIQLKIKD